MSDKKPSFNRRDLLKLFGLGGVASMTPMEMFLESLVGGVLERAAADQEGQALFKYILLQEPGAPPRWSYDLLLRPYGGEVKPNGSVATEFTGGSRYTQAVYKTHKVKGVNVPVIWTQNVAGPGGSRRPFSDLMDNMVILQGIDALNPGHAPARGLMNRPLTKYSIDGVLADAQNMPFASLEFDTANLDFSSSKGHSPKQYNRNDDIGELIPKAFNTNTADIGKKYHNEINNIITKVNRRVSSLKLGGTVLNDSFKNAENLIVSEINEMSKVLPALEAKYQNIMEQTSDMISRGVPGLTDKPVGKTGNRNGDNKYRTTRNNKISNDNDMRDIIRGAYIPYIAKFYAVTEYVITKNLTSNATLRSHNLRGKINNGNHTFTFDQHRTGAMVSTLVNASYYSMVGAMTLGLIDSLKDTNYFGKNMFDYTVIRHGGEFSRSPRNDGTGSDHAPDSSVATLFSGMIKGPYVLGELRKETQGGNRQGSRGAGGKLKHGVHATTGHVISSIATMLGVPSPSSNNPSLLRKTSNGEVVPNDSYVDKTKVV